MNTKSPLKELARKTPRKPLRHWTKSDFRPHEIELWIAYNEASNECLKFNYSSGIWKPGVIDPDLRQQVCDSLRDKESQTLARLEAALLKRRLDPKFAILRLNELQSTARKPRAKVAEVEPR